MDILTFLALLAVIVVLFFLISYAVTNPPFLQLCRKYINPYTKSIEEDILKKKIRIEKIYTDYDTDLFLVTLNRKKTLKFKLSEFKEINRKDINDFGYRLISGGVGVNWPELDVDYSLKGFFKKKGMIKN